MEEWRARYMEVAREREEDAAVYRARIARLESELWKERASRIALRDHGKEAVRGATKEGVLTQAYEELVGEGLLTPSG